MSTTKEDRIKADFKARLKRYIDSGMYAREGMTSVWLPMAQNWKMPIQELKRLIHGDKHEAIMTRNTRRYESLHSGS